MPIVTREPRLHSDTRSTSTWHAALLIGLLTILAGCAGRAEDPAPHQAAGAPAPGTARVYFGGRTDTSFGKSW